MAVEILHDQGAIFMRAKRSELLILPVHVKALKELEEPAKFSEYFVQKALVNRPARKLFQAWLRKETDLWPRLFKIVHNEVEIVDDNPETEESKQTTS